MNPPRLTGRDRVAEYVHEHGRPFTPATRPRGVRKRADKACFLNALMYVMKHPESLYVEGLAVASIRGAPVHHAWTVERGSDAVIELTWAEPGVHYLGVPFTPEAVAKIAADADEWGGIIRPLVDEG